jgi:type VI protein secretion system component VasF
VPETTDALPPSLNPRGSGAAAPARRPHSHAAPGGLSAAAAVVLLLVVTVGFALGTALTDNAFNRVFQIAYVVVTVYVALRIKIGDLFVAMVAPPLVYAIGMFVSALVNSESQVHSIKRGITDAALESSLNAPWLALATVLSLAICTIRSMLARRRA